MKLLIHSYLTMPDYCAVLVLIRRETLPVRSHIGRSTWAWTD